MRHFCIYGLLFLFACTLLFYACRKKEEKYTISGKTWNPQLASNVEGINVSLYARIIENGVWNSQYSLIESQLSQGGGSFSFTFEKNVVSDFKLTFVSQGYFTEEYLINPSNVKPGADYSNTYPVHLEAWLKVVVKNFPSATEDDFLSCRIYSGNVSGCNTCCNDEMKYFEGPGVDTSFICKLYGHRKVAVERIFTNETINQQNTDSVWINENDTTRFNVYY